MVPARTRSASPRIAGRYNEALVERAGADNVPILMAHFMVGGVHVDRSAPRGERELHMGEAYAATAQAIPAGPQYVAMGHIHAPQTVPGAPVPAEYAGSLLSLDFGEAGETQAGRDRRRRAGPARGAESIPLESGRRLARVSGTWDQIEARADELADAVPRPHRDDLGGRTRRSPNARARRSRSS